MGKETKINKDEISKEQKEDREYENKLDKEGLPWYEKIKPIRYRRAYLDSTLRNRYRLLWELPSDISFTISERNDSPWLDWSIFAGAPYWVLKKAKARSLTQQEYIGWRNVEQKLTKTSALAVRRPLSETNMTRLDAMAFDRAEIEIIADVARDHGVAPRNIVRWLEEEGGRQSFEKVLYLLEMRRRFDYRVTMATLKKFLADCAMSRTIFELLLEYVEEFAGEVSDRSVWQINIVLEKKFDGAADRLLAALNDNGWHEICDCATKVDRLTLAYDDLAEMGWEADNQDYG